MHPLSFSRHLAQTRYSLHKATAMIVEMPTGIYIGLALKHAFALRRGSVDQNSNFAVILHLGALASLGIDAADAQLTSSDGLPPVVMVRAVSMTAALLLVPQSWSRSLRAGRPPGTFSAAVLLTTGSVVALACEISPVYIAGTAHRAFWPGYAEPLTIFLSLAYLSSSKSHSRNAWQVLRYTSLLLPLQIPVLIMLCPSADATYGQTDTASLVIGLARILYFGGSYAFGARSRFLMRLK